MSHHESTICGVTETGSGPQSNRKDTNLLPHWYVVMRRKYKRFKMETRGKEVKEIRSEEGTVMAGS